MDHTTSQRPTDSYLALSRRIAALIKSPRATFEHQAVIRRLPSDHPDDWDRLLDELGDTEGLTLKPRLDGTAHVSWYVALD